jgi:hypothetical protein
MGSEGLMRANVQASWGGDEVGVGSTNCKVFDFSVFVLSLILTVRSKFQPKTNFCLLLCRSDLLVDFPLSALGPKCDSTS